MSSVHPDSVRLTKTVTRGGCAAKLPAGSLRELLSSLSVGSHPDLLVGSETMDDACLWRGEPGGEYDSVHTIDFFTPIVDRPSDFGAIAAANALSDIYAMGGEPLLALGVLAFPTASLSQQVLKELMSGACDVIRESGAVLGGGHSIDDDTLKFGLSVMGRVPKGQAWTNAGASVGDDLILTKALGTGTLSTALKLDETKPEWESSAIASMRQLNRVLDLIPDRRAIHAATDITGFGLAGHGLQMARASQVTLQVEIDSLPLLPGARECIEVGEMLNRAHRSNLEYVSQDSSGLPEDWRRWIVVDPQTSGGLLLSVDPKHSLELVAKLRERFSSARVIGRVVSAQQTHLNFC
jgi:selenide,water dikinase